MFHNRGERTSGVPIDDVPQDEPSADVTVTDVTLRFISVPRGRIFHER